MAVAERVMHCRFAIVVAIMLSLWSCAEEEPSTDLIVPRGATLSIRTTETITTNTHKTGDAFQGEINVPLKQGTIIYVPLLARVEGSVDSVIMDEEGRTRIGLRIERLQLASGQTVALRTVPLVRQTKPELQSEDITVKTGLDVDIDVLVGNVSESESRQRLELAGGPEELTIPRDSHLVFTLEEDIRIPAP